MYSLIHHYFSFLQVRSVIGKVTQYEPLRTVNDVDRVDIMLSFHGEDVPIAVFGENAHVLESILSPNPSAIIAITDVYPSTGVVGRLNAQRM